MTKQSIEFTVYSRTMTLTMTGDRVEDIQEAASPDEYGTHDTLADAVAEADAIASAPDAVKVIDQGGRGIGAVDHRIVYVEAYAYDEEAGEMVPFDVDGCASDPCSPDPAYILDALDERPDVRAAWNDAVQSKRDFLDYKADEYYTVASFLAASEE